MKFHIPFLFTFVFIFSIGYSQNQKKINKYKILSVTENITDSLEKTKPSEIKKFDKNGNLIFIEKYSKKGILKEKNEYKYSKKNLLEEEINYNENGEIIEIIKHTYNLDLLSKSDCFSAKNELLYSISYKYNGFSEKIEEIKTDMQGKLIEKSSYEYDNKGLKIKKTISNATGQIIEIKNYNYTFE